MRRRLLATPAYEVWLLGWTPGQSVGLHDHGDANGAFVVVDGELAETDVSDGALHVEVLSAGELGRAPGSVHDVANRSRRNATSIHAYSEPLSAMGFYGPDGALVRVEAVHEQSTLVDAGRGPTRGTRRARTSSGDRSHRRPPGHRPGRLDRVEPEDLDTAIGAGALVVDIRPEVEPPRTRASCRARSSSTATSWSGGSTRRAATSCPGP